MSEELLYSTRILDPFIKLIARQYAHVDVGKILAHAGITPWEIADNSHWLTQEQVTRFHEKALELTGNPNLAREAGQYSASPEVFGMVRTYILSFLTPLSMFMRIGDVTARITRSSVYIPRKIAGNAVEITVVPNAGVREEPFQCENRIGMFEAAIRTFHYRHRTIEHPECLFRGDPCCRYIIRWQPAATAYFRRCQQWGIVVAPFVMIAGAIWEPHSLFGTIPAAASLLLLLYALELRCQLKEAASGTAVLEKARDQLAELLDTTYNHSQLTSEIGQAISIQTSIDKVLEAVVKVLQKRLDFDRGMVLLTNKDKTRLTYRAGFGHHDPEKNLLLNATFRLDNPKSKGVFVRAFHEQIPYLVDDFTAFEQRHTSQSVQLAKALGVKSFVCCPIICDGESIGVLAVDNLKTSRPLMQSDKSLLMGIAPVIGVSIRNAELLLAKEKEFRSTLHVLAASIDARDPLTAGHSEKVTEYSVGICDEMKLGTDFRECLRVAALLHDYGKIGVPDAILKKEGRLTTSEYEIIKSHTAQTRAILERINFEGKYADVPLIAGCHHEKWNGNGYPLGLKGEAIPLGARIIAVADHFEAITAKRHYREPMPTVIALDELLKYRGSYFDPMVVDAFISYYRRCYNGIGDSADGSDLCRIRQKRVPLETPVMIQTQAHLMNGKSYDVSLNGIYISIPENLGEGLSVKIEIVLPGETIPVVASGRIAWVNAGDNRAKPHYPTGCGVELTNFDNQGDAILQDYINQHLPQSGMTH